MSHPSKVKPLPPAEAVDTRPTAPLARHISLDTWAVVLALATAALVKLHILNSVKW